MLIAATKLTHVPIMDATTHARIGTFVRCVFDADSGKLLAFVVKPSSFVHRRAYLSATDIQAYEHHAVVADRDAFLSLDELPRVGQALASKRPILGQAAQTKGKKPLGKVSEVVFDDATCAIMQIHTRGLLSHRIFQADDIDHISTRAVIFRDDQPKNLISELDESTSINAEISPI